jgi:hypothetical protein
VFRQPRELIHLDGSEAHPLEIVFGEVAMAHFVFILRLAPAPPSHAKLFP